MTLEAWVNPTGTDTGWRDVIYKGNDNYYLSATSTADRPARRRGDRRRKLRRSLRDAQPSRPTPGPTSRVTYDGANVRLYLNGTQVAASPKTGTITTSTNPLHIGGDPIWASTSKAPIDDVRVYNHALTADPDPDRHGHPGRGLRRQRAADRAGIADSDAAQQQPHRSQLDRRDRQRRRHRLPDRTLPGRRLLQLRPDRRAGRHRDQLQRHRPPPRPPATATASAPPTPQPTLAPTPTPPTPPHPPPPTPNRRPRRRR